MNLLMSHMDSWALDLQARNRSEATIRRYRDTITLFAQWQEQHGREVKATATRHTHVRDFLRHRQAETSPGTAAIDFRNLRAYFRWLVREEELEPGENPMMRVSPVSVPEKDVPVLEPDEIAALLKTTAGRSFENRRDRAIILTLLDNGVRVSGLVGLRYAPHDADTHDVHLDRGLLRVRLKGGRETHVPVGATAAAALDRYLRERAKHKQSHRPALWIGPKGPLTDSGVRQMLRRRAKQAEILHVHPHLFRHTAAHMLKSSGMTEEELMAVCGWESAAMAKRYGRSAAAARARVSHRRLSPADAIAG